MNRPYRADKKHSLPALLGLLALLLAAPFAATPARAQDAVEADGSPGADFERAELSGAVEQEIVEVKHADPEDLAQVLRVFPLRVLAHEEMRLITLKGARADLDAAVAAARRLDVPRERSPGVEVLAHILQASRSGEAGGQAGPALAGVTEQLKNVFGFARVDLVDTLIVRAADRAAGQVKGTFSPAGSPVAYRFGFNRLNLVEATDADGPREVRLDGLLFETDSAGGDVRLVTDLEVREGQQAVVGKAASGRDGGESLIVVVEVRVLD